MHLATQSELDKFSRWALTNEAIFPYLTTAKYFSGYTEYKTDWEGLHYISDDCKTLLSVKIDRGKDCDFIVSLYTDNPFKAGWCIRLVSDLVKRYRPASVNSFVHLSNTKSIRINCKIFGAPWGTEPKGAWNFGTGEYEDLVYFKKIINHE